MSADRLLSVEEAREKVFAAIERPTESEVAWLSEALGRVAFETVTSPISLPPWDNSAMDGYAIRAADTANATEEAPVILEVVGEVRAGSRQRARSTTGRRSGSRRAHRSRRVPTR